ncbi:DNA-binding Lrp family transcriptional regulator [Bacillus mesophilus]|uniref:Helix-turn-helix transcriptional regulator n=1 Tax=Bacillus mesophilus TaxID=1808955 RepID=A0A6M0Q2L9_9BACI|nr:helix-turn-helix domain-containing protein [Bacillus mesophilus]MBM7659681.1 DNA-binding Lrp family transcriptional regulator [Bacillus mesophilus]NEY70547.1 helix-turn-helix transcriptional regulator [Bacillus mesophilus]
MKKQLDYFEVKSLKQAKVLSHDLRMKIISMFRDEIPRTAKQIADELGMSASKVHYHVKELVKLELLFLTDTKVNGGIIEKYYLPIAKVIRIRLSKTEGEGIFEHHEQSQIINNTLREFGKSFSRSVEEAKTNEEFLKPIFLQINHTMLDEDRDELYEELRLLSEKWSKRIESSNSCDRKGEEYNLLLGFHKVID